MARFITRKSKSQVTSPVRSAGGTGLTHQQGLGYLRDSRSELFLLAVSNFVSQRTFYENGERRDSRFAALVRTLAVEDPEWTAGLLGWLRREGQMRTAALVGAAEYVKARLDAQPLGAKARLDARTAAGTVTGLSNRQVIASVLLRADEPGELLGYWKSRYGAAVPKPVKRGIADAVRRLYGARTQALQEA